MKPVGRLRTDVVSNPLVIEPLDPNTGTAYGSVEVGDAYVCLTLYAAPGALQPFKVTQLDIMPAPSSEGVSGTLLRGIPVQECARQIVEVLIGPMPTLEPMKGRKPAGEVLEAVLETYRLAERHMVPPCPEVQKRFGLSASSASRWIARAREELGS